MRKSKQDWIDAGINLLREEGEYALTIERLCKTLQITKGSFYHHFGDLQTYQMALLEWWESELTSKPIDIANQETNLKKRAQKLGETVRKLDHRLDLSIRAWGLRNNRVKTFVHRVDQRRLQALETLHRAVGVEQAGVLAHLEYVTFIGARLLELMGESGKREFTLARSLALLTKTFKAKKGR
jgi:AcrR family transcriptional regulator